MKFQRLSCILSAIRVLGWGWVFALFILAAVLVGVGHAQTATDIPQAAVSTLRTKAHVTFIRMPWSVPARNEEYAAAIQPDGSIQYFSLGAHGERFSMPAATVLLLHTHPITDIVKPSEVDRATAKNLGIPNCVVTQNQVWCALPDGTVVQER
jgi:hypothetical protein